MHKANVPVLKEPVPPPKRGGRKAATVLILLVLALLCVLFFRSSLSKVSEIVLEGNTYHSSEELLELAGVSTGDPYFGTSIGKIEERIAKTPSIQEVTVNKSFPGKLHILVKEYPVVAYALREEGQLEGLLANGTRISLQQGAAALDKPFLTGWDEEDPNLPKLCTVLAGIPDILMIDISEIIPSPTMSYPDRIKMYTRSQFEIITAVSVLKDKADYMSIIMDSQEPGVLTLLEADTYVPYEAPDQDTEAENDTTHD